MLAETLLWIPIVLITFRFGKYLGSGVSPTSGRGSNDECNSVRKPNNRFSGWQRGSSNMDREEGNTSRFSGWQIRSTNMDREIMNANRFSGLQRGNMTIRETSRGFEPYTVDIDKSKTCTTSVDRELTEKEMENKTKDILEDYLHLQDMVVNWPWKKCSNVKPFARSRQCTQIPYK